MKDKEWLKCLINEEGIVIDMNLLGRLDEQYWKNENIKINKGRLFYLIDQLDEPEKPVIPLFMAEHIIRQKELTATLLQAIGRIKLSGTEMVNWITNDGNDVLFCKAWLYGYEVEKEQKYRVVLPFTVWDGYASELKESTMFLALDITSGETRFPHSAANIGDYRTDLTESQIKGIDKRYWAFAEEVTE